MRVAWITENAAFLGGAEHYIARAAKLLSSKGIISILLYNPLAAFDLDFVAHFSEAFPVVDTESQLRGLGANLLLLNQWPGAQIAKKLLASGIPVVRFLQDHRLFCLREHKIRPISQRPCTATVGLGCYVCPGFIVRSKTWPYISIRTLRMLEEEQEVNRQFAAFVVPSKYLKDHAVAHGFPAERVHVIPPSLKPPAACAAKREENLLLYVGALTRGKGLDILLKAMTRMPPKVRLRVVGSGPQAGLFKAITKSQGLNGRVEFLGTLPRAQLEMQYCLASCLVIPSRQPETFCLVGPEALTYGTPVVAASVGGIQEWLRDGVTGLSVPPCDPKALAEAIMRLLSDPGLAQKLAIAGQELVSKAFSEERHVEALQSLFKTLVKRHG